VVAVCHHSNGSAEHNGEMIRTLALVAALLVGLTACGGDDESDSATTLAALVSTTSVPTAVPDSVPDAATETTMAPATSTTLTTPTGSEIPTTTVAPGAALVMQHDRLGQAVLGSSAQSAIDYVDGVLGPPADDEGWQSVRDLGLPCPGTRVRIVTWGDGLTLVFSDNSRLASDLEHFAGYTYSTSSTMSPAGLVTSSGIGLGSTVGDLLARYPDAALYADDAFGVTAETAEGLLVRLSGTGDDDLVTGFSAGSGCGV
jgi:hypothetical protein